MNGATNCQWMMQLLAEPPVRGYRGNYRWMLQLLDVEGLVTTWHVVPRHSRVPNVREFGNVGRKLELGYEANYVLFV